MVRSSFLTVASFLRLPSLRSSSTMNLVAARMEGNSTPATCIPLPVSLMTCSLLRLCLCSVPSFASSAFLTRAEAICSNVSSLTS